MLARTDAEADALVAADMDRRQREIERTSTPAASAAAIASARGADRERGQQVTVSGRPMARRGFRRFHLQRDVDETGISGVGIVAEGVQFSDGRCILRWTTVTSSTGSYDTILHIDHLHGHGGKTKIVWLDPE